MLLIYYICRESLLRKRPGLCGRPGPLHRITNNKNKVLTFECKNCRIDNMSKLCDSVIDLGHEESPGITEQGSC